MNQGEKKKKMMAAVKKNKIRVIVYALIPCYEMYFSYYFVQYKRSLYIKDM